MSRTGPKPKDLRERFYAKIQVSENGCWEWTGTRTSQGYGIIGIGSRSDNSRKKVVASRLSMELHGKPLPDGYFACHSCDNPSCVNPDHLFAGTQHDNMQDALVKGRLRKPDTERRFCRHGHEYTEGNTFFDRLGRKSCRQCRRDRSRDHYLRNREKECARARKDYWDNPEKHRLRSRKNSSIRRS